ncbi:unnamed protein product [Urochloa humidicola]
MDAAPALIDFMGGVPLPVAVASAAGTPAGAPPVALRPDPLAGGGGHHARSLSQLLFFSLDSLPPPPYADLASAAAAHAALPPSSSRRPRGGERQERPPPPKFGNARLARACCPDPGASMFRG